MRILQLIFIVLISFQCTQQKAEKKLLTQVEDKVDYKIQFDSLATIKTQRIEEIKEVKDQLGVIDCKDTLLFTGTKLIKIGELFSTKIHAIVIVGEPDSYESNLFLFEKNEEWELKNSFYNLEMPIETEVGFEDFNKDGIDDLTLLIGSGARSNFREYLFIFNPKRQNVTQIKGFEHIVNPELNRSTNIIESTIFTGTVDYEYYKINGDTLIRVEN